jgi:hypothetical protein
MESNAATYSAPTENSRFIGSINGSGAAGAGGAVDSEEVSIPLEEAPNTYTFTRHAIRSNYMDKSIEAKKKVEGSKCELNVEGRRVS